MSHSPKPWKKEIKMDTLEAIRYLESLRERGIRTRIITIDPKIVEAHVNVPVVKQNFVVAQTTTFLEAVEWIKTQVDKQTCPTCGAAK